MTKSDIAEIIGIIQARYPNAPWGPEPRLTVEAWYMSLGDLSLEPVKQALAAMFNESRFAPDPSEIRAWILDDAGLAPDPGDAWRIAQGAISSYYPGHDNSRIEMPEPVRLAVKAIGGLHNLKLSDAPEKDREAFMRVYATYRKRAMSEVGLGLPMLPGSNGLELMP